MFAFSSTPKTLKAAHATPLRGVQAAPHLQDISENTATNTINKKGLPCLLLFSRKKENCTQVMAGNDL
jgi:hypothetical protein